MGKAPSAASPPTPMDSDPFFSTDEELSEEEEGDSEDPVYIPTSTDPTCSDFNYSHVIVEWECILPHIRRCYKCLTAGQHVDASVHLFKRGAVVTARMTCSTCDKVWEWSSSKALVEPKRAGPKTHELNVDLCTALVSSGTSFSSFQAFCEMIRIPTLSKSQYHTIVNRSVFPAVDVLYTTQKTEVMGIMKKSIEKEGPLDLAGDGQYDSRGYSAVVCRYTVQNVQTSLILDFEVVRKGRGGNSGTMERQGFELCMPRLLKELTDLSGGAPAVKSFTSDRSKSIVEIMRTNFPEIRHHFDNWHILRSIRKDIMEVDNFLIGKQFVFQKLSQKQFEPLVVWVRPFMAHLRTSISLADGDGKTAFQRIMSFFYHVVDQHEDFQPTDICNFDLVDKCAHPPLVRPSRNFLSANDAKHQKAINVLKTIVTKGDRAKDFESVSPYFSTASVESFHSLSNIYLPKEHFFDKKAFEMRSKVSIVHWNELQFDELKGKRRVVGQVPFFCKTKKVVIMKNRKTKARNKWRSKLLELVRVQHSNVSSDEDADPSDAEESDEERVEDSEIEIRAEVDRQLYDIQL